MITDCCSDFWVPGPSGLAEAVLRAVAIYLIQLSCALSVKDTSALLGIPYGRSLSSVFTITRWASDPANARRLAAGLQALISELNNTPCLTDYEHRRDTLATWSTPQPTGRRCPRASARRAGAAQPRCRSARARFSSIPPEIPLSSSGDRRHRRRQAAAGRTAQSR
jgi:hypothetical protein